MKILSLFILLFIFTIIDANAQLSFKQTYCSAERPLARNVGLFAPQNQSSNGSYSKFKTSKNGFLRKTDYLPDVYRFPQKPATPVLDYPFPPAYQQHRIYTNEDLMKLPAANLHDMIRLLDYDRQFTQW